MMIRANLLSKIQIFILALVVNLAIVFVKAQEKGADLKVDINVNKDNDMMGSDWTNNPLLWMIGALILIIIIVLVARKGGRK
ncbi:hypothetical protein Q73A0000_16555 [Kaistella flava (ex Peng et al. 2021)]|uniref:Uncharacterized protein n=1 Tax=Kaistella flava (ex Peng et al. 2021) TaxID=2038776 RepID=A0A7M2YCM7_9FLAO|nr:hypothetical protein [Kaistella flava (ex Peng et al. 2021)]QOW11856.1 hypothetical protein Q73A0000_16555 [Kaistella flava (ex Peng et al. 2021)]